MLEEVEACCPQGYFDLVFFVHLRLLLQPGSGVQHAKVRNAAAARSNSTIVQTLVPWLDKM